MQIKRRFTTAGKSPYEKIPFRRATSEIKNPDGSSSSSSRISPCPSIGARWRPTSSPRSISARPACRRASSASRRRRCPRGCGARCADERALAERPEQRALHRRGRRPPGVRPPRRHLDLLGLEGRLLLERGRRPRLLRRAPLHAGHAVRRAQQPAMVQHRPALGLRHRRPRPGPLLRRPRHRRADAIAVGLRASPAARLLHPVDRGRSRQRERHHGSVGARGAPLQVRLRHRLQLLQAALREREAVGRRQVLRPDELPARSATAPPAPSSPAAPPGAPPRWWWSTSTTRTSRPTSTGR